MRLMTVWSPQPDPAFCGKRDFHGICPKDATGTLRISASIARQVLVIQIEDDGIGIDPHRLQAIWDMGEHKKNSGLRHIGLSIPGKGRSIYLAVKLP